MASTPEGRVKRKLDALINEIRQKNPRTIWWYAPQAGPYGRAGVPDRIGAINGHLFAVECKAAGKLGTITKLQAQELDAIAAAGGQIFVYDGSEEATQQIMDWLSGELAARILLYGPPG